MGQDVKDRSEICPLPPGPWKEVPRYMRSRTIMAVGLTFMLTTTGLAFYLIHLTIIGGIIPDPGKDPKVYTPHAIIAIDGDANFTAKALLEGWPGDGSPENPFIIESLDIDLGGASGNCISIKNTRVNFAIRNCNLTGASWGTGIGFGAGIYLNNVVHGELLNNIVEGNNFGIYVANSNYSTISDNKCSNNTGCGICIAGNYSIASNNTVVNNMCNSNGESGILLQCSDSNTVVNNTCYKNPYGIRVGGKVGIAILGSNDETVANNICNNNMVGIFLYFSDTNTVANNTCSSNEEDGISLIESDSNTVIHNTCNNNSIGIDLGYAGSNTITSNTCNNNDIGIALYYSHNNTVSDNTCNNNRIGIYIDNESESNTVENNACSGNTEHDIVYESELEELAHREYIAKQLVWFLAGCGMILVVSVVAFVQFRRMRIH